MDNSELKTVIVSFNRESEGEEGSYGCLVDIIFDRKGRYSSGSRLEWFPKKLCSIETIVSKENPIFNIHRLTCPKWLMDKRNVKYDETKDL